MGPRELAEHQVAQSHASGVVHAGTFSVINAWRFGVPGVDRHICESSSIITTKNKQPQQPQQPLTKINTRDALSPGDWQRTSATRHTCRVEPIVAWAEAVWDEQLDDADLHRAWRRQQRLVGLKTSWSKVSGPTGAIIMCLTQLGWTWPHHTTFVTASGHEVDLRQICPRDVKAQATVDSEIALWREWAGDSDERKELLPCPMLEPVILANKRAQRRPQEAPAIKAALGGDTIRVVDAGGCEQGGNC